VVPRFVTFLAATVAVLALACSGGTSGPNSGPNTVTGLVLVTEPDSIWKVTEPCTLAGPFKDLAKGTDIVVKDGSGKVIGTAKLSAGAGEEDDNTDAPGSETHICEFQFAVPGVATTQAYAVQVGNAPEKKSSLADMKARFWNVVFEFPEPAPQ
jgi:hypothetical protein